MTQLRVGIVGAGAIGCAMAVAVAETGRPPAVLARGATLAALRAAGVTRLDGGPRSRAVTASDDPEVLGEQDVLVLSTKAPAMSALAPRLGPMIGPNTAILPLVNGVPWWFFDGEGGTPQLQLRTVDPDGTIAAALPRAQIVGAVVNLSCSSPEPGSVYRLAGNKITIGSAAHAGDYVRVVGDLLRQSSFEVVETQRIREVVWYKLLGNASFNPISALTRASGDRIASDPAVRAICVQMMEEATAVAAAFGLSVPGSPQSRIEVAERLGRFKTSMLQDVEADRPLEHAALIGAIVEIADHFDLAIPVTRVVHGLVRLQDDAAQGRRTERADSAAASWQELRSRNLGH